MNPQGIEEFSYNAPEKEEKRKDPKSRSDNLEKWLLTAGAALGSQATTQQQTSNLDSFFDDNNYHRNDKHNNNATGNDGLVSFEHVINGKQSETPYTTEEAAVNNVNTEGPLKTDNYDGLNADTNPGVDEHTQVATGDQQGGDSNSGPGPDLGISKGNWSHLPDVKDNDDDEDEDTTNPSDEEEATVVADSENFSWETIIPWITLVITLLGTKLFNCCHEQSKRKKVETWVTQKSPRDDHAGRKDV